ncbi:MAG: hypothetical protein KAU14_04475 [Thermoplasmata archaeon]|nr:hypothetical protein [Thermoplasmata archaeon]
MKKKRNQSYTFSATLFFLGIFIVTIGLLGYPPLFFLCCMSIPPLYTLFVGLMFLIQATGMHRFEIFEDGFVIPKSHSFQRFMNRNYYVRFDEVKKIYLNKYAGEKLYYPLYVVILINSERIFIPQETISRSHLKEYFPEHIEIIEEYFDKFVIVTWPFKKIPKISPNYLFYHPPHNLLIKNDRIEIEYPNRKFVIPFAGVSRISLRFKWILKMKSGEKFGIYDISMDERWKILRAFKKWKKEGAKERVRLGRGDEVGEKGEVGEDGGKVG